MKKYKFTLVVAALSALLATHSAQAETQNFAASSDTTLRVINNWFEPIQVKEGWLAKKTTVLYAGRSLEWKMFTSSISNLLISYYRNGNWQPILGCPNGNYYHGLTANIYAAPWDPSTPVCQQY